MTVSHVLPPRRLMLLLILLVAVGPICTDLYLASLPDMARALGTDAAGVQMTLAAFLAGSAVMQLVYGPLSDRFGRRGALLGGLLVFMAGSVVCIAAQDIHTLIAGRLLQALGASSGAVVGRAVARDLIPREMMAKVMSYMASAIALAPLVAPTMGGWLHTWFGWRSNFVALLILGTLLLVLVWRYLAETNRHLDPRALALGGLLENYGSLLRHRVFMGYSLTVMVLFGAVFAYLSSASFVFIEVMGLPPHHFGFAFSTASAGFLMGGLTAGRLSHRVGMERMVGLGSMGCVVAGCIMAGLAWGGIIVPGVVGLAALLVPLWLYFVCVALVLPNSTAGAISPFPHMAGTASAAIGFLQMGGGVVLGWLGGRVFDGTARPMATAMAVFALVSLVLFLKVVKPATRR